MDPFLFSICLFFMATKKILAILTIFGEKKAVFTLAVLTNPCQKSK